MNNKGLSALIPEDQKDRDWHIKNHQNLLKNGTYNVSKAARNMRNIKYYLGDIDPYEEYAYLTVADNNLDIPVDAINYNAILPIIEQSKGMFSARGYSVDVHALSPTAISRKEEAKRMMEAEYDLLPLAAKTQQMTGVPLINQDMPTNKAELEAKKRNYKEMGEIVNQRLIDDFSVRYNFETARLHLFEQTQIMGDCHYMLEYAGGTIIPTQLRSSEVFYDSTARDPLLRDARFYFVMRYMDEAEIANRYSLTTEDLEKLRSSQQRSMQLGSIDSNMRYDSWRQNGSGRTHLVSTLYWKDIRMQEGVFSKDRFGNSHFAIQDKYPSKNSGKKIRKPEYKQDIQVEKVRFCTMIGDSVCPQDGWGEIDWIPRTIDDNWGKAAFPILSLIPRFVEGHQKSTTDLLEPLQGFRDKCFYMIARAMRKDYGKGFLYDRSQKPEDKTFEDVLYDLAIGPATEIESRMFGSNAGYNQFQQLDMSISPSVSVYINFAEIARQEMQRIAGIPDPAMGVMKGASQSLGVTQSSLQQTQVRSDWLYRLFDSYTQEILKYAAGILRKCVNENPDRYRNIIGDEGVEFIRNNDTSDLEDIGVSVLVDNKATLDAQTISEMTKYGVQNGYVDYADAMNVLMARGEKEMNEILQSIYAKRQAEMAQQRQMEQQMVVEQQRQGDLLRQQQEQQKNELRVMEIASRERQAAERNKSMRDIADARNASELQQALMRYNASRGGMNRAYDSTRR